MNRIFEVAITILFFLNALFIIPCQETISVASFNLGIFGPSKSANPYVLDAISHIIRYFDVVAVQEIRDKEGLSITRLLDAVNRSGYEYALSVSPRLGHTSSKEQYAVFYRKNLLEIEK
ncbi:MAG: hypothetical protein BWX81_00123 [Spirochaetes bacterium ADurb.Bin110]|jgi:endonuclease/exonuclease/phosphatase family metal-dependent hydrolase|nr:MAG: hypothetical protein BWX81_00123 [Spirochaetes bacterium ADurb.Bin110]HOM92592.1 endonuclease/exonuclease/phosphatase family protein [Rectinema sp.]HOR92248.1 endonuclease/exonuclease/phosphatase family protein [Rectinema sp.]HRC83770.1 endonuclease/exonuclease/phosphatase family protein [Rectinema sp.]HRR38143.1 endonuclease/exonuclease/phosphatase family protein [Rectinema sp.]